MQESGMGAQGANKTHISVLLYVQNCLMNQLHLYGVRWCPGADLHFAIFKHHSFKFSKLG